MTIKAMMTVVNRLNKFAPLVLKNAYFIPNILLGFTNKKCKKATMQPSNSSPYSP